MEQHYFIFREPETLDELKALLRLRYSAYMASRLNKFIEENQTGMDLDCYDLYSRHFGLYEHTGSSSRPVGYVRMVTDEPGTFRNDLFALAKSIPELYEKVNCIPTEPFPMMNYCPYADDIRRYRENAKLAGEMLVEVGRLSLDDSIRGLKIAVNFVSAICASLPMHGVDEALVTCVSNHEAMYRSCGGRIFHSANIFEVHGAGVCLLLLSAKNLPHSMKERVDHMREAYERTGRICYNPSQPESYYEPVLSRAA